ncbi:gamma-glutamyltransferase family protein [Inquilinus limosus]|uniref:gamma-glutamyltransferase n=1 Tax=Inquilinus limosus TaxID=171674 RepID=UPI003F1680CB
MADPRFAAARVERWQMRKPAAAGPHGVVTSQHYAAAEAGAAVLEAGGNAVDAAVTGALVLQTVEPWMSGLGACGYLMVAEPDGRVEVVEFTGRAPQRFDPEAYRPAPEGSVTFLGMPASAGQANVRGYTAAVVPGCIRGLAEALRRFGTIGFDRALAPAIERARKGMTVDWHATLAIAMAESDLRRDVGARAVLMPGDAVPEPETVLPLPRLAETLQRLADAGPEDFYTGRIAERLAEDLRRGGSFITAEDLAAYRPSVYSASAAEIAGRRVHVAGETSGGRRLHDALRHFDAQRGAGPLDPGFYTAMTASLRDAFAAHRGRLTPAELSTTSSTTQLNAADRDGRMVALTFTLLNRFGARVLSPATGVLLNNGMAWFDPRPGRANSLRPGALGPNNMCPVAITDADGPFAVLGASGGNQIVPALAQVSAMLLHAGMSVEDALNAPRINAGPTAGITVDIDLPEDCVAALEPLGPIRPAQRAVYPRPFASPSAIARKGGGFTGMADTTYPASQATAATR